VIDVLLGLCTSITDASFKTTTEVSGQPTGNASAMHCRPSGSGVRGN
jgi:hypothetical protein